MITNKINEKRYIGQTIQTLAARWSKHCCPTKSNIDMPVVKSIKKYGKQNFEIKVLSKCDSIKEMNHREEYYIRLFKTTAPTGYNLMAGGINSLHTEETKKKISDAQSGSKNHNFGKKASKETRDKMSKSHIGKHKFSLEERLAISNRVKGENHPMFGKHHSEEAKQKISSSSKGRIKSAETREKLSRARDKYKIKILCVQTNIVYDSISNAAKDLKLERCKIKDVARGKRKHTKGYSFEYVK